MGFYWRGPHWSEFRLFILAREDSFAGARDRVLRRLCLCVTPRATFELPRSLTGKQAGSFLRKRSLTEETWQKRSVEGR